MPKRNEREIDTTFPTPKYQRIGVGGPVVTEPNTHKFKFETALEFLEQVKLQFTDQPDVYKEFLRIMKEFKGQEIDTPQVIEQVSTLFRGYDHLIQGFGRFLPQGHQMKPPATTANGSAPSTLISDELDKSSKSKNEKVLELPTEQSDSPADLSTNNSKVDDIKRAQNFIKKIKQRFIDRPYIYKTFLEILKKFQRNEMELKDVFIQLTNLFQEYTDLLLEFPRFLPDPYQKRTQPVAAVKDFSFFENAKIQLRNEPHLYTEILKCLLLVNKRILTPADLMILVENLISEYPGLIEQFRSMCDFQDSQDLYRPMKPTRKSDGIFCKLEIDYSSCRRLGPSYRALPREYVQPPSYGRTALCYEVLNDRWVSLPTGSEEGANFKSSQKNQFEENLFKCEDDRYELDMLIAQNYSALQQLHLIYQIVSKASTEELLEMRIEKKLEVLHLRAIEKIYGDKGSEILSSLYENPAVAIPLVIRRLQQKDEEWRNSRNEWNKSWRVIHEKNYHKSLDHQGSTFKQKDKKSLTLREFIVEINKRRFELTRQNNFDEEHLSFNIDYPHIMKEIFDFLSSYVKDLTSFSDNEEFRLFMDEFFSDFFITQNMASSRFRVLYGGDEFYLFIRLTMTLYTRLSMIMNSSCSTLRQKIPTKIRTALCPSAKYPPGATFESVAQVYRYFVDQMLTPLLRGELDQVKYEEECKQLFGVSAYKLFTADRLFKSLVEQIEILCTDEETLRLLALYYFESNRVLTGEDNMIYRTNALEIIGSERCFRFVCKKEETQILSISLMDHPRELPGLELPRTKSKYKKYLREFLDPSRTTEQGKTAVFLPRNKRRTLQNLRWNNNLEVDNRLEAKICMTTFQLFYVQGTEDFFYRKGKLARRNINQQMRMKRMADWNAKVTARITGTNPNSNFL